MAQTGEEILGLGSEMLFAAVVLKSAWSMRVFMGHVLLVEFPVQSVPQERPKTSFDPYLVRFDPYPRPVVHQFL